jgi:serine/threonine-protein kinase
MIASQDRITDALAGRYELGAEIGRGGMAVVYRATDLRHGRPVAIKVLRPEIAAGVGADRFLAEIHNTAALQHPHILPLFDSGEAGGLLFYVMPFIEGENLRVRIEREGALPFETAHAIAAEVADALDHAHRRNIVHRDIKPENILLADRHALVADFGIGRALSQAIQSPRLTQANFVVGTPAYVSPEQASGEPDLDGRSDLYSLGCVLFEMLTSRPPFGDSPAFAVLHRRLFEDPPDVATMRPDVPEHLRIIVNRLLARDRTERFATGAQVTAALAEGIVTPVRFARITPRVTPHPSIAVLPFVNLSADPDTEYFSDGITDEIISALARMPELRVAARTSAFAFKGTRDDLRTIGERLKVATVLEEASGGRASESGSTCS